MEELAGRIEAVLFASGRFMDAAHIAELLEMKTAPIEKALKELQKAYDERGTALRVVDEEGAWKLHVRDEYLDLVSRVVSDTEVSGPVIETLAVIAWRSPVMQAEVVDVRGSNAYEHVKELVERGFVKKERSGRTYQLRITEKFFEYFDIEGREDIKKLFAEVEEEHRKQEMEVELSQKRLQKALENQAPDDAVVETPAEEQKKLPERKVDLDKLDEVLAKARKTREDVGADFTRMKQEKEEAEEHAEPGPEGMEPDDGAEVEAEDEVVETPVKEPEDETTRAPADVEKAQEEELEKIRKEAFEEKKEEEEDLEEVRKKAEQTRESVERAVDKL